MERKLLNRSGFLRDPDTSDEEFPGKEYHAIKQCKPPLDIQFSRENKEKVESFVKRISTPIISRESLKGYVVGMSVKLTKNERTLFPRLDCVPPALPSGINYLPGFAEHYKTKAESYQRRLAIEIVTQYQSMVDALTTEINATSAEAVAALRQIDDKAQRNKAIQLFHFRVHSVTRLNAYKHRLFLQFEKYDNLKRTR